MKIFNKTNTTSEKLKWYENYIQWCMKELNLVDYECLTMVFLINMPIETEGSFSDAGPNAVAHFRYRIKLNGKHFNLLRMITTIPHELCHMQQAVTNKMNIHSTPGVIFWNNVPHKNSKYFLEYFNKPWEVEARQVGRKLAIKYIWIKIKERFFHGQ